MSVWFVVGLVLLLLGAEFLVRGASRLAAAAGISPLVIGLTVVAFGTSAPELAVSAKGALSGQADAALGNVVGSNIFNVLFILGLSALITPLSVAHQIIRREVPLLIALSGLTLAFAGDGSIDRPEALALLLGLLAYTTWVIRSSRRQVPAADAERRADVAPPPRPNRIGDMVFIIAGLAMLIIGARWFVDAAIDFAEMLGISEAIIGLTIVAAGTSLPEVATSVVAAIRGERDIAVGNVIGSNLFNVFAVLGVAGTVAPTGLPVGPAMLSFDLPVMLATSVACLPVFATGHRIDRWEGGIFLAYYCAYAVYLALSAAHHDALAGYTWTMTWFVIPITLVTFAVVAIRSRARRHVSARSG